MVLCMAGASSCGWRTGAGLISGGGLGESLLTAAGRGRGRRRCASVATLRGSGVGAGGPFVSTRPM